MSRPIYAHYVKLDAATADFSPPDCAERAGSLEVAADGGPDQFRALAETLSDALLVVDTDSIVRFANPAVEDVFGYEPNELVGESLTALMPPDLSRRHEEAVQRYLDTGERTLDWSGVELVARRKDGTEVPVNVSFGEFTVDGEVRFTGVVRDVSERVRRERDLQRREEKLTALTERTGSLADAETPDAICEIAVDAAVEVLGFPNAAIALYDDAASELAPTFQRWTGGVDALLGGGNDGVGWRTFIEGESRIVDDLDAATDDRGGTTVDSGGRWSVVAAPLGKHGVFLAGAPERAAFDATDRSFADLLSSNVRSELGRAEREEALRDRRDELRRKNRELERVDRINSVVRELTKAVTRSSSPEEVMQVACERLTETGPYRFTWFGVHERATGRVEPQTWAGVEEGYLDEVAVSTDESDPHGQGPSGRAIRTGEVQVQNDLLGDPPFEPWREQALKRGYRSSASVPVVHRDTVRGVLNLYADEPDVFDGTEREVLSELGSFVDYALNALERERALTSQQSVELDFRIRGSTTAVMAFVSETGASFEFENVVQRDDGRLHVFFTIRGASGEETLAFAEDVPWIEDGQLVANREGETLYECTLTEGSFLQSLVDRGALPRTIAVDGDEGRFVLRVPQSADVRTFVTLFDDYYDDAELVARRERDEPVTTRQEFEAELADRLTDRQREVIRMAYFGGFFEWPRDSTAQELAEALGVSQPTVSRHLRGAERTLFGLLFDER